MVDFPEELSQCTGFQWDDGNSSKNWEVHQVTPGEAEQLFFNRPILVAPDLKHSTRELRYAALGCSDAGRRLTYTTGYPRPCDLGPRYESARTEVI
jgi:uncharacterized DUF497 family protein